MADSKTEVVEATDSRPVVVVSYGLSTQIELGSKDSPWHNASVTYSIPLEDGQEPTEVADSWMNTAKAFVLAELEIEASLAEDGTLQPVINMPKRAAKSSGSTSSAKATSSLPTVEIDGETWVDYRSEKASGAKPERFPDFKTPDNKRSEWIYDKDGSVKEKFAQYV